MGGDRIMPKNTPRTLGTSPGEVLVNSGGEQFFLCDSSNSPATISITWAQLPDGSQFPGSSSFAGSPAFSVSSTNYLWYRISTGNLENNTTGFSADSDIIPLWQFDVDGSGIISNIIDRRPWFGSNRYTSLEGASLGSDGLIILNNDIKYANVVQQGSPSPNEGVVRWRTSAVTSSGQDEFEILSPGITIQIRDALNNVLTNNVSAATIFPFVTNSVVYVDLNLTTPGATVPLQITAGTGAPTPSPGRVLLAEKISSSIVHWIPGNLDMYAADTNALYEILPSPLGYGVGISDGLTDPSGLRAQPPSATYPFATLADISSSGSSLIKASYTSAVTPPAGSAANLFNIAPPVGATRFRLNASITSSAFVGDSVGVIAEGNLANGQVWVSNQISFSLFTAAGNSGGAGVQIGLYSNASMTLTVAPGGILVQVINAPATNGATGAGYLLFI